jgi:diguanylate cyclase (GGDEF)-like protein
LAIASWAPHQEVDKTRLRADPTLSRMRILVADDEWVWTRLLVHLLPEAGFEPVTVVDGAAAWQIMSSPDAPSMAILDWLMPGMNGIDLVRRLRAIPSETPPYLIMLTARDDLEDIVQGLEAGADDYLAKPFHKAELLARLKAGRRVVEVQQQLLESRRQLAWQADHDPLTGIFNRRAILERLAAELERGRREGHPVAVAIIDCDGFKQVNDTLGHLAGDELLTAISCRLRNRIRSYDALGRLGGDEFLVAAPMTPGGSPAELFERLREAVHVPPLVANATPVAVSVSIGWALSHPNDTVSSLLARADAALYQAKTCGRNRTVGFPAELVPQQDAKINCLVINIKETT